MLESLVRQFVVALGGRLDPAVHPNQFLGLELNPRAAVIAELVLWIGWLRYRLANTPDAIGTPVLPPLSNINGGTHGGYDAVLVRTATGEPDVENPRRPDWPAADFIVGNPPFIGGKDLRERLGSDYAEGLWRANPRVPRSADFVMHWWDRAADLLTRDGTRLRRFGFVTTNSITQLFSRRVIEGWLAPRDHDRVPPLQGEVAARRADGGVSPGQSERAIPGGDTPPTAPPPPPLAGEDHEGEGHGSESRDVGRGEMPRRPSSRESADEASGGRAALHLTLAIPDHPWTRVTRDAAAVRIAMTVAEAGAGTGKLVRITGERAIDTDAPELDEDPHFGTINADLTVGTDVTPTFKLRSNVSICHDGVKLHGKGFAITGEKAKTLGLGSRHGLDTYIRPYRNGRDLTGRTSAEMIDKFIIDFYGVTDERIVRREYPEAYQHLFTTVRAARLAQVERSATADARAYLTTWWLLGKPRPEMRPALAGLTRYIATVDTAKHRIFQFLDTSVLCDDKVVVVASDQAVHLGVLQSSIHYEWVRANQGLLEDRPVYVKTKCFDTFPFPDGTPVHRAAIAGVAEELDVTRRSALAEDDKLTMTGLYNLVAAVRDPSTGSGRAGLAPADEAKAVRARARIVAKLHDDLDAAVAAAYGWEWPLPPAEIVARLVALNAERAAEEAAGQVRWLRPDYQIPRFGTG